MGAWRPRLLPAPPACSTCPTGTVSAVSVQKKENSESEILLGPPTRFSGRGVGRRCRDRAARPLTLGRRMASLARAPGRAVPDEGADLVPRQLLDDATVRARLCVGARGAGGRGAHAAGAGPSVRAPRAGVCPLTSCGCRLAWSVSSRSWTRPTRRTGKRWRQRSSPCSGSSGRAYARAACVPRGRVCCTACSPSPQCAPRRVR